MQADHTLDLRNVAAPFCFLMCKSTLASMRPGAILEVYARDPETVEDLLTILKRSGEKVVATSQGEECTRLLVQKGCTLITDDFRSIYTRRKQMSDVDLNSLKAASVVDARGSACPGPLLEAKKGIGKVRVGEVLEILSSDEGTKNDIPIWAKKVGHEYLGHLSVAGYDRLFVVRKK